MSLTAVSISHHTSPVALRERLAFSRDELAGALLRLKDRLGGAAGVILSTCNRVEVYAHGGSGGEELGDGIRAFLSEWHGVEEDEFRQALYTYRDKAAVGHLFRVASSLDSLVVGEAQILGQVRDAYLAAQTAQTTDKVINALFQKAFTVAKHVRTQTDVGVGKVSISSVAVELAASIFRKFPGKTALVIGSGKTGELALKSLVERGVTRVLVANRSIEKAQVLAASCNGEALALAELPPHLHRADIVISSTAAPGYVLGPADFRDALKMRGHKPMFVIDVAVPRDIEPRVAELDNVYLYDIDDLERVVADNLRSRRVEMERGMAIVEHAVDQFMCWMRGLAAEPTLVSISEELNAIRERELARTLAAMPDLTEEQRREVSYLTERIVRSILQQPMKRIKQEIGHHDPAAVLHLVKRIFGLKEPR